MDFLILFATSVAWIFVQAFQSRNVNSGNYALAAGSSFLLGTLQVHVLSTVVSPQSSFLHTLLYCAGGSVGVVLAMLTHKRFVKQKAS